MPYYHCHSCQAVFHSEREEPFEWCDCGQTLDCSSVMKNLSEPERLSTPQPLRFERRSRPLARALV